MPDITLTYFDISGSRGEECRLALRLAGLTFTDRRLAFPAWRAHKDQTPWGTIPTLEVDGQLLGQTNAILTWIGTTAGLHPTDPWEAARHQAVMEACEEVRHAFQPAFRARNPAVRRALRAEAGRTLLPTWGARFERELGQRDHDGPFLSARGLCVADLKLYMLGRWFASGVLDHVPTTVWEPFEQLQAHHRAVAAALPT